MFEDIYEIFPYQEFKKAQSEAIRLIWRHKRLMLHAPTGFGKTIVSLASLIPKIRHEEKQLIILTRTKTQIFSSVMKEIKTLAQTGNEFFKYLKVVPLVSKEDLCINKEIPRFYQNVCHDIKCRYYKTAKEIENDELPVLLEQLPVEQGLTIETVKETLGDFACPYYLIRRAVADADILVGTHSYLQTYRMQHFFAEYILQHDFSNKIVLIDEAHNFGPTVEATLSLTTLQEARKITRLEVIDILTELILSNEGEVSRPPLKTTLFELFLENYRREHSRELRNIRILERILDFLTASGDVWFVENQQLLQLNPLPAFITKFLDQFHQVILVSGTFSPLHYYQRLYEMGHYHTHEIHIPQDQLFVGVLKNRRISSKFEHRRENTLKKVVELIHQLHTINPFHTLVLTPSHNYKNLLLQYGVKTPYIEKQKNPHWLSELAHKRHELIIGVLGGRLSEGVEILEPHTKRSLITLIIIVGLPYPEPTMYHQFLFRLYSKKWNRQTANDLLLTLPVLRKVQQAIGRGIRNPRDFSAAVILDYRAALKPYFANMRIFRTPQALYDHVAQFYLKFKRFFFKSQKYPTQKVKEEKVL